MEPPVEDEANRHENPPGSLTSLAFAKRLFELIGTNIVRATVLRLL